MVCLCNRPFVTFIWLSWFVYQISHVHVQVRKRPLNKKEMTKNEEDIIDTLGNSLTVHETKLKVSLLYCLLVTNYHLSRWDASLKPYLSDCCNCLKFSWLVLCAADLFVGLHAIAKTYAHTEKLKCLDRLTWRNMWTGIILFLMQCWMRKFQMMRWDGGKGMI